MLKCPQTHLGFRVGSDRYLADWEQITHYFEHLSQSERMKLEVYGTSTEGRPMLLATISAPENLDNLAYYRAIQTTLADPRGISEDEIERCVVEGKSVVLITCSVHATEVGAAQMSMELAYDLVTCQDADTQEILENVIFLFVPSLNPDGLDLVVEWYRETLGTPAEGSMPPKLYQKYTGHDNNRDWFMLTQVENRQTVEAIHNVWHPHIVHDQHQMGGTGPRFVLPPFTDPYDPNVDPVLRQEVAWLGQSMAAALTNAGKAGVATNIIYDGYSPSRAYQHYHGGVRILSEAASVKVATPIHVRRQDLIERRGFDASKATWNHPLVWEGGDWTLRDIVDYNKIVAWACLQHAAKYRKDWVRNFHGIHKRAVERTDRPFAFVIKRSQRDVQTAVEMVNILQTGMVEIEQAKEDFVADGICFKSGDLIVRSAQPYGAYARTLLAKQDYPDLRLYPGGPPKRPYDITAHSLPLQMGVACVAIDQPFVVATSLVPEISTDYFKSRNATSMSPSGVELSTMNQHLWTFIRPESNKGFRVVNQALQAGAKMYRLTEPWQGLPLGTFVTSATLEAQDENIVGTLVSKDKPTAVKKIVGAPRLGLYKSHVPNADEGWTRFILEDYAFSYESLSNEDIKSGRCSAFDVIILPSHAPQIMDKGLPATYPEPFAGGLGEQGAQALLEFVHQGGILLALDAACDYLIHHFWLPVKNTVKHLPEQEFYVPGSFLRLILDTNHPLAYGMEREVSSLFLRSPAFQLLDDHCVVAKYPSQNILLSGWILGERHLFNQTAIADITLGQGRVILYGLRPQFRAQTRGTYKLLFNGIFL